MVAFYKVEIDMEVRVEIDMVVETDLGVRSGLDMDNNGHHFLVFLVFQLVQADQEVQAFLAVLEILELLLYPSNPLFYFYRGHQAHLVDQWVQADLEVLA